MPAASGSTYTASATTPTSTGTVRIMCASGRTSIPSTLRRARAGTAAPVNPRVTSLICRGPAAVRIGLKATSGAAY